MSFVYTAGLNNMGSYQVSGRPWLKSSDILTGEEQQLEFPKVTKNIKIIKLPAGVGNQLKIGFATSIKGNPVQTRAIDLISDGGGIETYETSTAFSYGNTHTISLWVNFAELTTTIQRIIEGLITGSTNAYQIQVKKTGTSEVIFRFQVRAAGGGGASAVNYDFTVNVTAWANWSHIVLVRSGAQSHKIYVNGSLEKTITASTSPTPPETPSIEKIKIGGQAAGYVGKYDEMTIWNTNLGDAEISSLYNSGNYYNPTTHLRSANLKHWWAFEDNNGGFVHLPPDTAATILDRVGVNNLTLNSAGAVGTAFANAKTGWLAGGNVQSFSNFVTLNDGMLDITLNAKCKKIFIYSVGHDCTYSVYASLTGIPAERMYDLTGPGIDE